MLFDNILQPLNLVTAGLQKHAGRNYQTNKFDASIIGINSYQVLTSLSLIGKFTHVAFVIYCPRADPGFPIGGVPTLIGGGANLRHRHFSVKTYVKTKEFGPVGGGGGAGNFCM